MDLSDGPQHDRSQISVNFNSYASLAIYISPFLFCPVSFLKKKLYILHEY